MDPEAGNGGDEPTLDLRDQISELAHQIDGLDTEILKAQLSFLARIPSFLEDPDSHDTIVVFLADLPPAFRQHYLLRALWLSAVDRLPPELHQRYLRAVPFDVANEYMAHLSGTTPDELKAIKDEMSALDAQYQAWIDS